MSHARIRMARQEAWHHNVVNVTGNGDHITLELDAHPSRVHFWLGCLDTSVLLCATADDVTSALRAEHPERDFSDYCTCLSISRDPYCVHHGDADKVRR